MLQGSEDAVVPSGSVSRTRCLDVTIDIFKGRIDVVEVCNTCNSCVSAPGTHFGGATNDSVRAE